MSRYVPKDATYAQMPVFLNWCAVALDNPNAVVFSFSSKQFWLFGDHVKFLTIALRNSPEVKVHCTVSEIPPVGSVYCCVFDQDYATEIVEALETAGYEWMAVNTPDYIFNLISGFNERPEVSA